MTIVNKKETEKKVSEFFCDFLNKIYNKNYKTKEDILDTDTDYLLLNKNKEQIKLQITTCDKLHIEGQVNAMKNPRQIFIFEPKFVIQIFKAIEKKCIYPNAVQKELTLLIYSKIAKIDPNFLKKETEQNCPKNSFKNIYFIELPHIDESSNNITYPGNIIRLK